MSNNSKLSFKEKFSYGLGDTASHFSWDIETTEKHKQELEHHVRMATTFN